MKTTLTLLFALFLGFVALAKTTTIDPSDLVAGAFVVALAAWTALQYRRQPRPLTVAKPVHLPIDPAVGKSTPVARRRAA